MRNRAMSTVDCVEGTCHGGLFRIPLSPHQKFVTQPCSSEFFSSSASLPAVAQLQRRSTVAEYRRRTARQPVVSMRQLNARTAINANSHRAGSVSVGRQQHRQRSWEGRASPVAPQVTQKAARRFSSLPRAGGRQTCALSPQSVTAGRSAGHVAAEVPCRLLSLDDYREASCKGTRRERLLIEVIGRGRLVNSGLAAVSAWPRSIKAQLSLSYSSDSNGWLLRDRSLGM